MEEKPGVPMLIRPRLVRRRTAGIQIINSKFSKLESQENSHNILNAAALTPPPYQPENEVEDDMFELEIKQRLAALRGPGYDDDHIDAYKPKFDRIASNSNVSSNEILAGGSSVLALDTLLNRSSDQLQLNSTEKEVNFNRNFGHNKVVQEQEMILKIIQEENFKKQIQEEATMKLIAELMEEEGDGNSPSSSSLLQDNRGIAQVGIQLNGIGSNKHKLGKYSDVQSLSSGRRSETVARIIPTNDKVNLRLQGGVCDGAPTTLERQSHSSFEHERVRVANELKRRIEAQEREFLAFQKEKSNEAEWQRVPKRRHHRAQKSRTSNRAWC